MDKLAHPVFVAPPHNTVYWLASAPLPGSHALGVRPAHHVKCERSGKGSGEVCTLRCLRCQHCYTFSASDGTRILGGYRYFAFTRCG